METEGEVAEGGCGCHGEGGRTSLQEEERFAHLRGHTPGRSDGQFHQWNLREAHEGRHCSYQSAARRGAVGVRDHGGCLSLLVRLRMFVFLRVSLCLFVYLFAIVCICFGLSLALAICVVWYHSRLAVSVCDC